MSDQSHLDKKYFIDLDTYNCPFCNRKNLPYKNVSTTSFDWSPEKKCFIHIVQCSHRHCEKRSAHFSNKDLRQAGYDFFSSIHELDKEMFHHQPSSSFTVDSRIPLVLRELINEADQSQKMNFLTGASACMRKAIYEFLVIEKIPAFETKTARVDGKEITKEAELSYERRIKLLKDKYSSIDPSYFDDLSDIQAMTSDKVHEQSWDKWDSDAIKFLLKTLQSIFHEIYILPAEKRARREEVLQIKGALTSAKKVKSVPASISK